MIQAYTRLELRVAERIMCLLHSENCLVSGAACIGPVAWETGGESLLDQLTSDVAGHRRAAVIDVGDEVV